ncbi:hypothetical protein [Carbonactinospora thermoautotrophica]|uniref:hypothetical protein n=2 Tax=Carbonactinospora thermoautotrophica TaxID=1469144 RepID=UPI00226F0289|nr:hypothetical protein [Carbonactinospora thermoautotrophica]
MTALLVLFMVLFAAGTVAVALVILIVVVAKRDEIISDIYRRRANAVIEALEHRQATRPYSPPHGPPGSPGSPPWGTGPEQRPPWQPPGPVR